MLPILMVAGLFLPCCACIHALRRMGDEAGAQRLYAASAWALGGVILLSMAAQETILLLSGQLNWRTGLPLHLCSLMGVTALPALVTRRPLLMNALLFAGLPGAGMALLFPAVMATPWPEWTLFTFRLMHAGLFFAPLLPLSAGWRPDMRGPLRAGAFLLGAAAAAAVANVLTGANYLFLAAPVAGTPLVDMARRGQWAYRLLLGMAAAAALAVEVGLMALLGWLAKRRRAARERGE